MFFAICKRCGQRQRAFLLLKSLLLRCLSLRSIKIVVFLLLWNVILLSKLLCRQFLNLGDNQVISFLHSIETADENDDKYETKHTTAYKEPKRARILHVLLLEYSFLPVILISLLLRHAFQYDLRVTIIVLISDRKVSWI